MTIPTTCPGCNHTFQVNDSMAGKKFRCKKCQTPVTVPTGEDDWDDSSLPQARSSTQKRRKRSTNSSHNSLVLWSGIGAVSATVLIGLGFFLLDGGEAPPATASSMPTEASPLATPIEATLAQPTDAVGTAEWDYSPAKYGGPPPDGMILSQTLIKELAQMGRDAGAQHGKTVSEKELEVSVQSAVCETRAVYTKFFCIPPHGDPLLAQGKGNRQQIVDIYNYIGRRLEEEGGNLPAIVPVFHEDVTSGKASRNRIIVLTTIMSAKLMNITGQTMPPVPQ